jgi:hypothetical protein
MTDPNPSTRTLLVMLALVAAVELFRPAPAMTQRSLESSVRDIASELRSIRQELSSIERKMK